MSGKTILLKIPDNATSVTITVNTDDGCPDESQREVGDLGNGEVAYTTPWALAKLGFEKLGINKGYLAYSKPGGTVSMKIQRWGNHIRVERGTVKKEDISCWDKADCMSVKLVDKIRD